MGTLFTLVSLAVVAIVSFTGRSVPTEDGLRAAFSEGQRLYAAGDYDQAIERYQSIVGTRSEFLDVSAIEISVGDLTTSISEAALYQLGNANLKRAEEAMRGADKVTGEAADLERAAGQEATLRAAQYFGDLEANARTERMAALAQRRLVEGWYGIGDYDRAIVEATELIERYPSSEYVESAIYDLAWANFEQGNLDGAVRWFSELLRQFPTGYRADRSYFQLGECYFLGEEYEEAISFYQQVVDRTRVNTMTERDLLAMRSEKLAGLVDETALELAAKAQLKVGDANERLGRTAEALKAYEAVIKFFSQEHRFAEEGYLRLAEMYFHHGDLASSTRVYRDAIDQNQDRLFQARMQYLLAERYFQAGRFLDAAEQFRQYERAYGDVAAQAGIPLDRSAYRLGRSLYSAGESGELEGEIAYRQAAEEFDEALERHPGSSLATALAFNAALALQMLGDEASIDAAQRRFEWLRATAPEDEYARHALLQLARVHVHRQEYVDAMRAYRDVATAAAAAHDSVQLDVSRFELGVVLRDDGQWEEAVEAFTSVGRAPQVTAKSWLEAGALLVVRERWDEALAVIERSLFLAGDGQDVVRFRYLRAQALAGRGDYDAAAAAFTVVLEEADLVGLAESARFGRARARLQAGDLEAAAADLEILHGSEQAATAHAALRVLARIRLQQGRHAEALALYEEIARDSQPEERAEAMLLLAELHHAAGHPDLVLQTVATLLNPAEPDRPIEGFSSKEKATYLRGSAYAQRGEWERAAAAFAQGVQDHPRGPFAASLAFGLGEAQYQAGDLDGAVETLTAFVADHPDAGSLPFAYFYIGVAAYQQSRFETATMHLGMAADRYPDSPVAPEALYRGAESLFNLRRFEEALARYRRVFENYPEADVADDALYGAAWSAFELERIEEGVVAFESLLERYPDSPLAPAVLLSLGDHRFNEGNLNGARAAYVAVRDHHPEDELATRVPDLLAEIREIEAYETYQELAQRVQGAVASREKEEIRVILEDLIRFVEAQSGTRAATGALNNMGACYEVLEQWDDAMRVYLQVLSSYEAGEVGAEAYFFAKEHADWIAEAKL